MEIILAAIIFYLALAVIHFLFMGLTITVLKVQDALAHRRFRKRLKRDLGHY